MVLIKTLLIFDEYLFYLFTLFDSDHLGFIYYRHWRRNNTTQN